MEDGTLRRLMLIDVSTDADVADEIYMIPSRGLNVNLIPAICPI